MKKYSPKRRLRDVKRTIVERKRVSKPNKGKRRISSVTVERFNRSAMAALEEGVKYEISATYHVTVYLPRQMNLSSSFYETMKTLRCIRILSESPRLGKALKLGLVAFDELQAISSSAALLLTAELSKWDDAVRNRLIPRLDSWDKEVLARFLSLGFFDLFPNSKIKKASQPEKSGVKFVQYLKGNKNSKDYKRLKAELSKCAGQQIEKWAFLQGGLDEAITNVGHHAYPDSCKIDLNDQNWYMTGAYDPASKELKIVFCDQGIGIPASLPNSKIWEHVVSFLSKITQNQQISDRQLIRAAMEARRSRTGQSDRGKGLPDMKEFIRQRNAGYLTIMSGHGMYKYTVSGGEESSRTDKLDPPILGTLIIWKVELSP